jgi:hypothetical protein
MRFLIHLLTLLVTVTLAVAQVQQDCSSADCNEVEAETCYAAGMGNSMTNILRCITMPGEAQAEALRKARSRCSISEGLLLTLFKLCACYTCANQNVQKIVNNSNQCTQESVASPPQPTRLPALPALT